jgi:hypothetical protein
MPRPTGCRAGELDDVLADLEVGVGGKPAEKSSLSDAIAS